MKIKVTFEKIYDSDEFYNGYSEEDLKDLTFDQFQDGLYDELAEELGPDDFKYEKIEE